MCGIVSAFSFDGSPVNDRVRQQFKQQKNRGVEGFGLYDPQNDNLVRSAKGKHVFRYLADRPTSSLLFHHRLPTSIGNIKRACHPFSTGDKFKTCYVLVHNGHIHNALSLIEEHAEYGISYHSELPTGEFNDSESLLWDFALWQEGKIPAMKSYGAIAFVAMAIKPGRKHDKIFFYRNGNPLNMVNSRKMLFLSSAGEGKPIDSDSLYEYNYVTRRIKQTKLELPLYDTSIRPVSSSKGKRWVNSWEAGEDDELAGIGNANDYGYWNGSRWVSYDEMSDGEIEEMFIIDEAEHIILEYTKDSEMRKRNIDALVNRYMWTSKGNYAEAWGLAQSDIELLEEYCDIAKAAGAEVPNAIYTMAVVKQAKAKIYNDPGYKTSLDVDKAYAGGKTMKQLRMEEINERIAKQATAF